MNLREPKGATKKCKTPSWQVLNRTPDPYAERHQGWENRQSKFPKTPVSRAWNGLSKNCKKVAVKPNHPKSFRKALEPRSDARGRRGEKMAAKGLQRLDTTVFYRCLPLSFLSAISLWGSISARFFTDSRKETVLGTLYYTLDCLCFLCRDFLLGKWVIFTSNGTCCRWTPSLWVHGSSGSSHSHRILLSRQNTSTYGTSFPRGFFRIFRTWTWQGW